MQINHVFDTEMIANGFKQIGQEYIERSDFGIVDYQEMIVHYLLNCFLPDHTTVLEFITTTSGQLIIDDIVIPFNLGITNEIHTD